VPYGDIECLKLPEGADGTEDDYVIPAEVSPTGWHARQLARAMPGESAAI
jgi:glutathione-independent formaldehyde dehydrogenase